jgi:hypothetical protein
MWKEWTLTKSTNVRNWQMTWTVPTTRINGGIYENGIGLQERKWEIFL